ncbi:MAG: relaxase/mobilization nuclease domain-containing protein [Dyadobacter sp.]|uniref:relaxase/mobilization nuclease domain-containing protein n=1 Tax=Dyadobacter sp. TaxID=1914288 RepID=UPI0032653B06
MVAVINTSSRLRAVLQYNEKKLEQGHAECISAFNYPKDADALSFDQKLNRIQQQLALNKRTKVNTVHVSLNFDPSEKLSKEQLAEISKAYLKGIGFEKQPALVYEHRDAGHRNAGPTPCASRDNKHQSRWKPNFTAQPG